MKNFLTEDKKIVSGRRAKKDSAAPIRLPAEELRKSVRRAVKSVSVPADLEAKVWSLLREQL